MKQLCIEKIVLQTFGQGQPVSQLDRLNVFHQELFSRFNQTIHPTAIQEGKQNTYAAMGQVLIDRLNDVYTIHDIDLLVLTYQLPDLTPMVSTVSRLLYHNGWSGQGFALSNTGIDAPYGCV